MTEQCWHAEELGLLGAIHDSPRDDALRLVYADWLDERSDPLGEFIRLHLALSAERPDGFFSLPSEEAEGPAERLRQLAASHQSQWFIEAPPELAFTGVGLCCVSCWAPESRFFKGLPVYEIYVTHADFATCFDAVAAWIPPRGQVYLQLCVDPGTDVSVLLAHPFAERAAWLELFGKLDWSQRPLGADPSLGFDRRFPITRDQVVAVAGWSRLRRLFGVAFLQIEDAALPPGRYGIAPYVHTTVDRHRI
jgi:uncharacterized protein (TIGR02996 family)